MTVEQTRFSKLLGVGKAAAQAYGADEAGRAAAALSFYTLFSLVPMMFLIVAVAGFILDDVDRLNSIVQQIETAANLGGCHVSEPGVVPFIRGLAIGGVCSAAAVPSPFVLILVCCDFLVLSPYRGRPCSSRWACY